MDLKFIEQTKSETHVEKPRMYKVLIHNDDYTTMNFVVEVLVCIFKKQKDEANKIMYTVHRKGMGIAGVYCYDIAATKMAQAIRMAKNSGFPLKFSMEED
ncbi:ATP-dependent Clp protease adaptor ClpS [Clostridium tyrobutyricum]|uniref:ATP-dependent Clp protease adaptor ClpS n=1 Tax=Clostridium tyrobutyricum TaxID=1519 RepID=UPI001C391D7C|nr:ATP-dependent Clp protease adaptor ClpS [Clostridium tyrobutyricum]MBV4419381.1 ATP-dependent Clp protease adaptor ClpS [Clostridium tyrobutyricum]